MKWIVFTLLALCQAHAHADEYETALKELLARQREQAAQAPPSQQAAFDLNTRFERECKQIAKSVPSPLPSDLSHADLVALAVIFEHSRAYERVLEAAQRAIAIDKTNSAAYLPLMRSAGNLKKLELVEELLSTIGSDVDRPIQAMSFSLPLANAYKHSKRPKDAERLVLSYHQALCRRTPATSSGLLTLSQACASIEGHFAPDFSKQGRTNYWRATRQFVDDLPDRIKSDKGVDLQAVRLFLLARASCIALADESEEHIVTLLEHLIDQLHSSKPLPPKSPQHYTAIVHSIPQLSNAVNDTLLVQDLVERIAALGKKKTATASKDHWERSSHRIKETKLVAEFRHGGIKAVSCLSDLPQDSTNRVYCLATIGRAFQSEIATLRRIGAQEDVGLHLLFEQRGFRFNEATGRLSIGETTSIEDETSSLRAWLRTQKIDCKVKVVERSDQTSPTWSKGATYLCEFGKDRRVLLGGGPLVSLVIKEKKAKTAQQPVAKSTVDPR